MVAFFTTVGITGSLKLLATGGKTLIVYILVCWFVVFFQDVFGAGLAMALGVQPIIGIMAGAVSLTSGHGNACSVYFTGATGYSLPAYVGAMVVAIIARNINDFTHLVTIHEKSVDIIGDVSLGLFLTMAMMTLKILTMS